MTGARTNHERRLNRIFNVLRSTLGSRFSSRLNHFCSELDTLNTYSDIHAKFRELIAFCPLPRVRVASLLKSLPLDGPVPRSEPAELPPPTDESTAPSPTVLSYVKEQYKVELRDMIVCLDLWRSRRMVARLQVEAITSVKLSRLLRYSELAVGTIKDESKSLKKWTHDIAQRKQGSMRIWTDLIWLWDLRENGPAPPGASQSLPVKPGAQGAHSTPARPRNSAKKRPL
jgi:hypothetical protein